MNKEINEHDYFLLKSKKLKRAEIAEYFGIPDWKLKKLISKNGWGAKRPTIDRPDLFSKLTEESAYWAGFIAADGYISDNNDLQIVLNYDDTDHLEKFRKCVGSNHKITSNTSKYYRSSFGFKNDEIVSNLRHKFNITPRKSLKYQLPNLPSIYMRHFIRGYFDGDGCICESFSNKNSSTATLYTTVTGSIPFIEKLQFYLEKELNITGTVQIKKSKNEYAVIKYCTNDSKVFLRYLYDDSAVFLNRKQSLYRRIIVENIRLTR